MPEESDPGVVKRQPSDESAFVADAVRDLATAFAHHPGFMWTESGFEVIHADWPAYPIAHGVRAALYTLADYPPSTKFYSVDNIDACTLFSVNRELQTSARNPEHLWAAVWDDDLRELSRSGLVDGIANLDDDLLGFPDKFIEVSPAGRRLALVYELTAGVHPEILAHVDDFLRSERFDTAVREASILVEQTLRDSVLSSKQGSKHQSAQELVNAFFVNQRNRVLQSLTNTSLLQMKAEFLKFFAYVRNEFAHRLADIDVVTASRLLRRCSRLLRAVELIRQEDKAS